MAGCLLAVACRSSAQPTESIQLKLNNLLGKVTSQTGESKAASTAIETEAQIFAWYDTLAKSFKSGDRTRIVSAFAPDYFELTVGQTKEGRDEVVKRWKSEPAMRGKNENGPGPVLISKLVIVGEKARVEGYWYGTWRSFPDSKDQQEGGMTWEYTFISEWKKTPKGWMLAKTLNTEVTDSTPSEDKMKVAHAALKAKYKRG